MKSFVNFSFDVFLSNFDLNKYPYKLTFAITYRCNYKCNQCGIWRKKPMKEMKLEEIELFAKKFPYFKWLNLTGGEPFLRKDFVEIIEIFLEHSYQPLIFNSTTNGFNPELINKKVLEILSLKPPITVIVVSLDGYKELHEKIRGVTGSFDNALETFMSLKEISKKYKNFKTFFGYTINPFNVGKFKETFIKVKEKVKNLSPRDFHINLYHVSNHYYGNFGIFDKKEIENYERELVKELKFISSFKNDTLLNPIEFLDKKYIGLAIEYVKNNKTVLPCKVVQSSVFIDPVGNVFPCTIFDFKLGNLREFNYDLSKILNQEKSKKMKKMVRMLKCPNCWTPCEAYQTILGNMKKVIYDEKKNFKNENSEL